MEQRIQTRSDHRSLSRTRKSLIDSIHHIGQTKQGDEKAEWRDIRLGQARQILAGVGRGCCCPGWGSTFIFFWWEEKRVLTAAEDLSPVFESISSEGSVGKAALRQGPLSMASLGDWWSTRWQPFLIEVNPGKKKDEPEIVDRSEMKLNRIDRLFE